MHLPGRGRVSHYALCSLALGRVSASSNALYKAEIVDQVNDMDLKSDFEIVTRSSLLCD